MADFTNLDELEKYACTSRQNLNNWNNVREKQAFLRVVIAGAKQMKAFEIKQQAINRTRNR